MADHWHLRNADWLATLPRDMAEAVRRHSTRRVHAAGDPVFGPTRQPDDVYLLEEGLVRIYRASAQGDEYTLEYVRPSELFGEVAVLAERPRESFAEARRRSVVLRIPRQVFLDALRSSAAALYQVTTKMGRALLTCRSRAEDLVFRDVRSRLAHLFLRLGDEFGTTGERGVTVELSLTHRELATLVGASRQTVSVALAELTEAGAIERRRRETVLRDRGALARLAQLPTLD